MDTTTIIIIAAAAVVVAALAAWAIATTVRYRRLRDRFGPEYERVEQRAGSRREAANELEERQRRRERFDIRPLDEASAERYRTRWRDIQADFVESPEVAVRDADALIQQVMRERGYPVDDFEQRAADLSVDHPEVVQHYREGHRIATRRGGAAEGGTEDLRRAMMHHRRLFEELVATRTAPDATGGPHPAERDRQQTA